MIYNLSIYVRCLIHSTMKYKSIVNDTNLYLIKWLFNNANMKNHLYFYFHISCSKLYFNLYKNNYCNLEDVKNCIFFQTIYKVNSTNNFRKTTNTTKKKTMLTIRISHQKQKSKIVTNIHRKLNKQKSFWYYRATMIVTMY